MQWYYSKNSTQLGPVSQDELIAKIASGEVSPSDLVWKDGMADWIPSSQVPELRGAAPSQAAPSQPAPAPVSLGGQPTSYGAPVSNPIPHAPVGAPRSPVAGKASTAMTLGIVSMVLAFLCGCLGGLPCGILAIVFGNQYKKAAETDPSLLPELGKAKNGIMMGWIGIAIALIMTIVGVAIQVAAGAFNPPPAP